MTNYDFKISITGQLSAASIANIKKQINDIGKNAGVKINTTPIKETSAALKDASRQSTIFGQSLTSVSKKILSWTLLTGAIFGVINGIKNGISAVVNLDTALVELRKVTNLSGSQLETFTQQAMAVGDDVARTTEEVVRGTSSFARMGYTIQESLNLSKQAAILVNIGDGIDDMDTATSAIVATLKGFNLTADQTGKVIDSLNEVSNNYAVDTSDLVDGISRVSASMAAAGNSLDQTIAMITSATEVIRDSSRASVAQFVTRYVQKCA